MILRACPWTAAEVATAVAGVLSGPDRLLAGVCTDTRDPLQDQLFVALPGERFDAHDFLAAARDAGAGALLVESERYAAQLAKGFDPRAVPVIRVEDSLYALGELARAHRRRHARVPVYSLTGSNGKTTTKELLAAILGASRRVLKTEGNLNNLIGVPMTLFGLDAGHGAAVVEMGMNAQGEIARYTEIARPDLGMVINVGPAHIGMLGSLEKVAEAKGELYAGLSAGTVAVVNADDPQVLRVVQGTRARLRRSFGKSPGADVQLLASEPADPGQRIRVMVDGRPMSFELPLPGAHNALNAAAAIAAATAPVQGAKPAQEAELRAGLLAARGAARRLVYEPVGPWVVVDDCYNANSASMLAAIATVAERAAREGRRVVALLGEMRELGEFAPAEHRRVGEALAQAGVALVAALGPLAADYLPGPEARGIPAQHQREDVRALHDWLLPRLQPRDLILVKGSRGMKMERFIELLRAEVR